MNSESTDVNEDHPVPDNEEVTDQLRNWANRWAVLEAPYVAGLLRDLPTSRNMTMWSSRDPFACLPTPELTDARSLDRLVRVLTLFRNVLIFLPVAVTWLAIGQAVSAFADYAETFGGESANFLQFWQQGGPVGDHLSSHWRIGFVATLDFALIALIILATMFASLLRGVAAQKRTEEHQRSEAEREELAIELSIALAGKHWATPESVAESVQEVINRLTDAVHKVNEATSRLDQTARTVMEASSGVSGLASNIDSLNASSSQLGERLEDVSERMSGEISRAVNDLGQAVNEFRSAATTDTARAVQAVADFRLSMTNDSAEATRAVANLSSSVADETARTLETIRGFNDAVGREVLGTLNQVIDGLQDINSRLEDSSERLVASNSSVGHGTMRLREDLDAIGDALGRLTERLRPMNE